MIDKLSLKVLKYIKKNDKISINDLKQKFGDNISDNLNFLEKDGYIIRNIIGHFPTANGFVSSKGNEYRMSPKGSAYIQEQRTERIKYWVPIILSNLMAAAALVVSIIALSQ